MALVTVRVNPAQRTDVVSLPDGSGGFTDFSARRTYTVDDNYLNYIDFRGVPYLVEVEETPESLDPLHDVAWYEGLGAISGGAGEDGDRYIEADNAGKVVAFWRKKGGTWGERYVLPTSVTGMTALDTVGAMKSLSSISNGTQIVVAGYNSVNDGGGGRFRRNTSLSSFDEGITFDMTGGAAAEAGGWERIRDRGKTDIPLKWFGAVGDAATDDTAKIQACMNYISNIANVSPGGAGRMIVDQGSYVFTSLTWPSRVRIEGQFGGATTSERYPEFLFAGTDNTDAITFADTAFTYRGMLQCRNMFFKPKDFAVSRPRDWFTIVDRTDLGFRFEDVEILGPKRHAWNFQGGTLNLYCEHFRVNGNGDFAIYVKTSGADQIAFSNCTFDNRWLSGGTDYGGGGAIHLDSTLAANNQYSYLGLRDIRIEINLPYNSGQGTFKFGVNPAVTQKTQFHIDMASVSTTNDVAVSSWNSINVEPATDFVRIAMRNCRLGGTITGIPSLVNSVVGTAGHISDTLIAPHNVRSATTPTAERTAFERVGLTNFIGSVYKEGQEATMLSKIATGSLPNGTTVQQWDAYIDPGASNATTLTLKVAQARGTVGTLAGSPTGSATNGGGTITASSVAGLAVGMFVNLAGAFSDARIIHINPNTNVVTVNATATGTVTDAALTYKNPTFKTATLTLT